RISPPPQPGVASPSCPTREDGLDNACFFVFDAHLQHVLGQSEPTREDETRSGGRSEGNSRGGRWQEWRRDRMGGERPGRRPASCLGWSGPTLLFAAESSPILQILLA